MALAAAECVAALAPVAEGNPNRDHSHPTMQR
jgi:hypothetical protein